MQIRFIVLLILVIIVSIKACINDTDCNTYQYCGGHSNSTFLTCRSCPPGFKCDRYDRTYHRM